MHVLSVQLSCVWTNAGRYKKYTVTIQLLVEVTIHAVLFAALLFVIILQILYAWIFEYLDGPTLKWGGPTSNGMDLFSGERVLKNTPNSLFEQPLKFVAHGRIFESLRVTRMLQQSKPT